MPPTSLVQIDKDLLVPSSSKKMYRVIHVLLVSSKLTIDTRLPSNAISEAFVSPVRLIIHKGCELSSLKYSTFGEK
jgi:hypothetical protein